VIRPGDAAFVRTGPGTRWYTQTSTFYDGAPGIGLECARWFSSLDVCIAGADNFAVEVVPPVDPEVFDSCHQHLIIENGIHLQEGMTFEGLIEREASVFAYVFAPLPIVGATGSPGNPIAVLKASGPIAAANYELRVQSVRVTSSPSQTVSSARNPAASRQASGSPPNRLLTKTGRPPGRRTFTARQRWKTS
jgi:hypothetical protein